MVKQYLSKSWVTLGAVCAMALAAAAAVAGTDAAPGVADDWHKEVVYQIYPRSFSDSDGDGIGDLQGIVSKVPYLHGLGVDVVWINPIYKSSHYDGGYDVTDYTDIDPVFGTLKDWNALRDALHANGMKIMMDLVLNHSSDAHPWFIQETHLKELQYKLTGLMRRASAAEGESIVTLLADPGSKTDSALSPTVTQAAAAITAFVAIDDSAAESSGYPEKTAQLSTLARSLSACAEHHNLCPQVALPLDDFYIWRDRPNNWTSLFSGPAWHRNTAAHGYFLSIFSVHQIDLNWRNPRVRLAMAKVVSTWEARGVDGLRLDSLGSISKDPTYADAAASDFHLAGTGFKSFENLPAVHRYLRELARNYTPQLRVIGEAAFSPSTAAVSYAGIGRNECKEVFVFDHISVDCDGAKWRTKPFDVKRFKTEMGLQQRVVHDKAWLGNYLENHDQLRIVSRYGDDKAYRVQSGKLFATLLMTLEGTPYIYQGQELGMTNLPENTFKKVEDIGDIEARNYYYAQVKAGEAPKDVFHQVATRNRDNVRSAMQWSTEPFAGFSTHTPEVHVNDNFKQINVAAALKDPDSILHYYQKLIAMRRETNSWVHGLFRDELPNHEKVFAYTKTTAEQRSLVLLNFSGVPQPIILEKTALLRGATEQTYGNYRDPEALAQAQVLQPWEARIYVGKAPLVNVCQQPASGEACTALLSVYPKTLLPAPSVTHSETFKK
jgi:oligo-1,6-glucosidase